MLNELFKVLDTYDTLGQKIVPEHNDIQRPGAGTTVRILLGEQGQVLSALPISKEEITKIWTIGNGNKNQFPCAKLIYPLRPGGHQAYTTWRSENNKPRDAALFDCIQQLREANPIEFPAKETAWPDYRNKIADRGEQLRRLDNGSARCVFQLYQRYLAAPEQGLSILSGLDEALWAECQRQPEKNLLQVAASIMFGEGLKNGIFPDGKRTALLIDWQPDPDQRSFASSRSWVPHITEILNKEAKPQTREGFCPLSGEQTALLKDKFPKKKLPVIGNTTLYSRYDGSGNLSVRRYGLAKSEAYSVSENTAARLGQILADLTAEKLNKKTWDSVPSEAAGPDLLVAYCRSVHEAFLVPVLTGESIDEDDNGLEAVEDMDDYKANCETVFAMLAAKDVPLDALVDIFILRKINDGNQKVVYSTSQPLMVLQKSVKQWVKGCANVPSLKLTAKFDDKIASVSPWTVPPKSMVFMSNKKHIRNGDQSVDVACISFSSVMKLFLVQGEQSSLLATYLRKFYSQFSRLLEFAALSRMQSTMFGKQARVKTDLNANKTALMAVSVFGLLLHKSGRNKEDYMQDLAFKMGQIFSAVDELHLAYCDAKRKGDIPATLLGNQSYGVALKSPQKAMSLLASRIRPYENWATRENAFYQRSEDEAKKLPQGVYAWKWLKRESPIVREKLLNSPHVPDDLFKSELMLGFLAGRSYEKIKKTDNTTQEDKNNSEENTQ